jgi:drug/metabolite transporter (DMT)-like permease
MAKEPMFALFPVEFIIYFRDAEQTEQGVRTLLMATLSEKTQGLRDSRLGTRIQSHDSYIAVVLMLGSGLFMSSVAATVKFLSDDIPVFEIVFFRNFTGGLIVLAILLKRGINPLGNNRKVLAIRGISGTIGVIMYFYAISNLVLADAVMLNRTSPFFVIILSSVFLHEKLKKLQIPALMLAFIGIMFISRPRFDVSFFPAAVGLLSAVFAGTAYTTLRHLRHTDTPLVIIFYFTMVSSLAMIPVMALGQWETPDGEQWGILIGLGLMGLAGQHLMTYAYRYAKAGEVAIYGYSSVLFAMTLGAVVFHEIPSYLSFIGAGCIITAAYLNARASIQDSKVSPEVDEMEKDDEMKSATAPNTQDNPH